MLPEQPISFPEFVADQLLTAKNLNDLFHYLDVQERGTRTNLIGIGIVCGLELKINNAGTEVTITSGCGITSQGYLVRWDERTFGSYIKYNPAKETVYDLFYAGGAQKQELLDELKADASGEGITKLTKSYLDDKVVLLFVELERIDAKNCDPESCDDKGVNITQAIRPLLVTKKDAAALTGGMTGGSAFGQTWQSLPELHMPRHHVTATDIFDSGDVFEGFLKVLNAGFLGNVQKTLSLVYQRLQPLIKDLYPSGNPFSSLSKDYAFLHNGKMSVQQLLYVQYYYDLFADLISAYEELRKLGMKLLSLCCPDEMLYPRHILLGATTGAVSNGKLEYRHYFIPSPAKSCHGDLVANLRSLFKRMVLMLDRFSLQSEKEIAFFREEKDRFDVKTNFTRGTNVMPIRITPSTLGPAPLSEKAIPFYYNAAAGSDKIYEYWNFERTRNGSARKNLSYNAKQYADPTDGPVLNPLQYDLEPYNFLRIEGHVGHRYTEAVATINQIRDTNRLPFDVVALSADIKTLRETLASIAASTSSANLRQGIASDVSIACHFQDLEALYDTMAQGLICNLCKEMKYYYPFPASFRQGPVTNHVPQAPLLKKCDPSFRYQDNTLGDAFEDFFAKLPPGGYIEPDQFFGGTVFGSYTQKVAGANVTTGNDNGGILLGIALLYYIEKLSEIMTTSLLSFNISAFQKRYADLMAVAQQAKQVHQALSIINANNDQELAVSISEDIIDHLDSLLQSCREKQFAALYSDYRIRWVYLAMLQKLGYYVKMNPGIQHKAGVTVGGTFIVVYHERSRVTKGNQNIFTRNFKTKEAKVADAVDMQSFVANAAAPKAAAAKNEAPAAEEEVTAEVLKEMKARAINSETPAPEAASPEAIDQISAIKSSGASFRQTYQISTAKLKSLLTAKQMNIIDRLFFKDLITQHLLDELTAQLPDKIVIADFFLPYHNGSDCPPVYFIVNETVDNDPEQPTISIKDKEYCGADKTAYDITVTPAGGSFGDSEGVLEQNGVFLFNPSAVAIPEGDLNKVVKLTYTKDGLSASVNVTVYAKPKAAFELIPATTYNFFVFSNKSTGGSSYTWDFGDGVTSTLENPSHAFTQDGTYLVRLTVKNGVCTDTIEQELIVAEVKIDMANKSFCGADANEYPITVSPAGGAISGEGTAQAANGSFVFRPSLVAFTAAQTFRDLLVGYKVGTQLRQIGVRVYRTVDAAFTINPGSTAMIRNFQSGNGFAAQHLWTFGDGATSTETNPTHQYNAPGTYTVSLTVTNGDCKKSTSQSLSIVQASINITPTIFCSASTQATPVTVAPSGGTISGEGTSGAGGSFTFTPAAVAFTTGQTQKIVTIGYSAGGTSAQQNVTVFRTPNAAFQVTPGTASALSKTFATNVGFTAAHSWDFGDGTSSTQVNPTHTFPKSGNYKVTLTVTNGQCSASTFQNVAVSSDAQPPVKTCSPLSDVVGAFNALPQSRSDQFPAFKKNFKSYSAMQEFMKALGDVIGKTVAEQRTFFANNKVDTLFANWFKELNEFILSGNLREISLAVWSILMALVTYVECIQTSDIDKSDPSLAQLMDLLSSMMKGWSDIVKKMTDTERQELEKLLQLLIRERNLVISNEEDQLKPLYLKQLQSLVAMLTDYLR